MSDNQAIHNNLAQVEHMVFTRAAMDFPTYTRHRAALMMLDTIGVAIAAAPMDAGIIARNTAVALYGSGDNSTASRMMFDGRQTSFAGAAFALASQIDNLDGHDGFNPAKGHVGVVVLPTLAALMEIGPDMSGPEALAIVITGYEVASRAAISLHSSVADYHTSGAWNALGVVAMCARGLAMDPLEMRHALGIAEYHGPRSQMMREIATPTMLHDGSGWGAMAGLSAVHMARQGFTGAPAITIEDDAATQWWSDMGATWYMEEQYVKPYPICRWAHPAIDAVRSLKRAHGFTHDQIASIKINSFHEAACLFSGIPDTTSKAQYSLGFAVACMVVHDRIGLPEISGDGLHDSDVTAMINRITTGERAIYNERFPHSRWADARITLNDGTILESGETSARGGSEHPLSDDEIIEKYYAFARPIIGQSRAEKIHHAIIGLEAPSSKLSDLEPLIFAAP